MKNKMFKKWGEPQLVAVSIITTIMFMTLTAVPVPGYRFEAVDPMQWVGTPYQAETGVKVGTIDIKFVSPCGIEKGENWTTTYDIKTTAYKRLEDLCQHDYEAILQELSGVTRCYTKGTSLTPVRSKRIVPLVIGSMAIVAVVSGKTAYRYFSPSSDLNRINALEEREKAMNDTLAEVKVIISEASDRRKSMTEALESTSHRSHHNKNAILQLAVITPDIAWTSSGLATTLQGIQGLKNEFK